MGLFKLSPDLERELKGKGKLVVVAEAFALIVVVAVGSIAYFMFSYYMQMNGGLL